MRQRWEWLTTCSTLSVVGLVVLWVKYGAPPTAWAVIEDVGMILCLIIGLAATLADYQKKWPAGVALVCAAPAAQNILLSFPTTMQLVLHIGVLFVLFLVGAIGAVVTCIAILAMQPPRPPGDEIVAKARIVR